MYFRYKNIAIHLGLYFLCYSLFYLQACRRSDHNTTVVPPSIMQRIDSMEKRSYSVPIDEGLVLQQQIYVLAKQYGLTDEVIGSYCHQAYLIGRTYMDISQGKALLDSAAELAYKPGHEKMQPVVDLYYSILYNGRDDTLSPYYLERVMPKINELTPHDRIWALGAMGNIHAQRNNSEYARKYYDQALNEAKKLQPRDFKAEIALHDNLAINHFFSERDTLSAVKEWRKGIALITDSIEKLGEIEYICGNFGQNYIDRGMTDSALPLINKYAEIVADHYTQKSSLLLPNIYFAQIAFLKKDYRKADSLLATFGAYIDTIDFSSEDVTTTCVPGEWFVNTYYTTLYKVKKAEGDLPGALKALEDQIRLEVLIRGKKKDEKLLQYDQNLAKTKSEKTIAEQEKKIADDRSTFFLLVTLLLLAIVIGLYIFFRNKKYLYEQKQKALQQHLEIEQKELLLNAEIAERRRIAQELHDELGGALTVIGMATQMLRRSNIEAIATPVEVLERNSQKLATQINEIVWSLNDSNDTLGSLLAYVQRYGEQLLSDARLKHNFNFDMEAADLPIDGYKRRYLYYSIKECLNNIIRHSAATEVYCSASVSREKLVISIEDNGNGMPDDALLIKGNGIDNINNNIQAIGGNVVWERKTKGTCVVLKVPLSEMEATES
ncbi:hypothetical protein DBR32_14710 [Taibaiella sp. KBW10]|uniref:sensor histidine kinase n=1 Tax=Taibaiella sp. KBW10 TaxID=2153357 RepID=UPI000F5AC0AB|nr:histidine kinase [Taibaiella sp. KBW10]RQO29832.1 hypothetical protein DBR32_14710 [Taibaiella sp. KBW10]